MKMSDLGEIKDKFELELDEKINNLKSCQSEKNTQSCLNCEQFFECNTRKMYVSAVYESMRKGQGGGFDFDG